jgi:WD40 repeat protein
MLDDDHIIYSAGICYKIHNIKTGVATLFFSKDGGGIGSIAVNKSRKYYAVAEKGDHPNIYIYEYPSNRLYRVLRGGTDKSYSNVCFSNLGDKIASVGSEPDFNICVWDWRNEILVLKSKAFSQSVFRVGFSDYSETILSTCGIAHLRFWKIANTFTGLKLKGQTGKFGSVELSDITGFYVFPDGKVLSGSDAGQLLLWEGNLVKAVLNIDEETPCHRGNINVVIREKESLISAGLDGVIRYWSFKEVDNVEGNDFLQAYIKPTFELAIISNPEADPRDHIPANIQEIVPYEGFWIIHDSNGRLFKYVKSEKSQYEILNFNSGKIQGMAISKTENALTSIGEDGAVRLIDLVKKKEYYSRQFKGKGTCVDWLSMNYNDKDRLIAAGYDTGVVRILFFTKQKIALLKAMKVHNCKVLALSFSPSGDQLAVLSDHGEIFFLNVMKTETDASIEPICIHYTHKKVRDSLKYR